MTDFEDLIREAKEPTLRPTDQVVEDTLLTGLFTTPEARARIIADTRPDDYFFDLHRRFASVVYPALSRGAYVDRVTVEASLPDPNGDEAKAKDRDDLLTFADRVFAQADADAPDLGKVDAYLGIFVEAARKRQAAYMIRQVGESLDRQDLTPSEAASQAFDIVTDLDASRRLVGAFKSEADDWSTYFEALEAIQSPGRAFIGLDTGFDHLNHVVNGLTPGLIILGAAPSVGKTTFVKQLVDQVAALNPKAAILFASYEQSREELRVKTLSRLSGVENRDILRGRLDTASTGWSKVRQASATFKKDSAPRQFVVEADGDMTPGRLRLAALQVKRMTEAEDLVVIVDYLQIMPTDDPYQDKRRQVDELVSDLRRLARDLDATVVAVSALGRASYESGKIDAFKESGGIEYGADVGVVMLPRKGEDGKPVTGSATIEGVSREYLEVDFNIVKNRNGERATMILKFYPAISRFNEIGQPETFRLAQPMKIEEGG